MSEPIFRLATLDDIAQLVELRILMQLEVHRAKESDVDSTYPEAVREYLLNSLGRTYISAVAEVDGKLVSANGLTTYYKFPSLVGKAGKTGYVSNVYTLPEWRGRGIACELMKLIVEYAHNNDVDKLYLGATELGKGVYERVGFKDLTIYAHGAYVKLERSSNIRVPTTLFRN